MKFTYEVGDVVRLAGHEPPSMTVELVIESEDEGTVAGCVWFSRNGELLRARFPVGVLVPAKAGEGKPF